MNNRHGTIWYQSVGTPAAGKRDLHEATLNPTKRQKSDSAACDDGCHEQDPWTVYKQRAVVFCGRYVALAHHREHQSKIVHIERLSIDRPGTRYLIQTVERLSHESFLKLLEAYYYENRLFLVWEPVELSVREILDARAPINEPQLAQIILPILQGIVFLREKGRALAKLDSKAILLNKDGIVRLGTSSCPQTG
ncbi:uncharacterized protein LDX57_007797 [Aspergillus melleus]|uniref:uncharacterized protein n=1 Tax=Aspergillus melleus TaxID=138277 RepID=UPI001E8DF2B5|nr:uncharacterized protein LDX57_007785 [Aspergillus melleus]XP_045945485.1 uncharacterized protein LDX57_007797 [Aspergillus melleus]KAH8430115.1 hypothetical protein LDX57_007785 [Aspergillus melleus]KAH8430127.1 hypothetical protein LDX57_007797 [Aspergillus melleus]